VSSPADERPVTRLALATAGAWFTLAAGLSALVGPITAWHEEQILCFLPLGTRIVLAVLSSLRAAWGVVPLGALVLLLLAPARIVPPGPLVRRWLWLALAQAFVVAGASLWALLLLPPYVTCYHTMSAGCSNWHLRTRWFPLALPPAVVALPQLRAWWEIARVVLREPRGALGLEVVRVAFVAAVPGAFLAAVVAAALVGLDPPVPDGLLVPLPLAGAGTALLVAGCAAIVVRTRSEIDGG
jgi:hypothetical protein